MTALDEARALLTDVTPPDGRADLTNPQKITLAHAIATIELAEQQRLANILTILAGSHLLIEHDTKNETAPAAIRRQTWRNELREYVRTTTGVTIPPLTDGK